MPLSYGIYFKLTVSERILMTRLSVLTQYRTVTDGQNMLQQHSSAWVKLSILHLRIAYLVSL